MLVAVLVHLYPRAWRDRYGPEMTELLASQRLSLRTVTDLVAGAIDARLAPQRVAPQLEGATPVIKRTVCNPAGVSKEEQWRSAAWMVGGSLVLVAVASILNWRIGPNSLSEGLMYSSFPAAVALSSECTYLRRYSGAARKTMAIGTAIAVIAITWVAVMLGNAI